MSMKNSIDTIGNRTRDLLACSPVPQLRHRMPPTYLVNISNVKLLMVHFSPFFCHFLPLYKHTSQHSVLKHPVCVTHIKHVCRHFEQDFSTVTWFCFPGNQKDPDSWWSRQHLCLWWICRRRPSVIQWRYTEKQRGELFPYLGNLPGIRNADLSCQW